ncbi:hypothetical protein [Xanthomonas citri]|uniref:hypothetical protein n=1 Tax=Xanthomonas citri TaxID=346 RepID=UPI000F4D6889|nr:hypothetical protein [Xanthomonas citri]
MSWLFHCSPNPVIGSFVRVAHGDRSSPQTTRSRQWFQGHALPRSPVNHSLLGVEPQTAEISVGYFAGHPASCLITYEKPTNWTLIGDGTGHRRQMNWMRVPEALDSAASTHFSDLAAFVFRMELGKG